MKVFSTALLGFFLLGPMAMADGAKADCTCDHKCQENCKTHNGKDCKCKCGCKTTGKCAHGKCAHGDKKEKES